MNGTIIVDSDDRFVVLSNDERQNARYFPTWAAAHECEAALTAATYDPDVKFWVEACWS